MPRIFQQARPSPAAQRYLSSFRRSSRSAAAQNQHAALDTATDDLELGGRGAQAVATTELTESGYEDPTLHGDASVAHRLE